VKLAINTPTIVRISEVAQPMVLTSDLRYKDRRAEYDYVRMRNSKYLRFQLGEERFNEQLEKAKAAIHNTLLFEDDEGYYTYSGLVAKLSSKFGATVENNVSYPESRLIPWDHTPKFPLRDYQIAGVEKLLRHRHAAIEVATGGGKSRIAMQIAKTLGLPTVVVAPTTNIADQLLKEFIYHFGRKFVGQFYGGKKQIDKLFTIAIGASVIRVEEGSEEWNFFSGTKVFIGDECFPYKTSVLTSAGSRAIGSIVNAVNRGEEVFVKTLNEQTQQWEFKRVLKGIAKPAPACLTEIVCERAKIRCTDNHKFLTLRGWVEAVNLRFGDWILTESSKSKYQGARVLNDDQFQAAIGSVLGDGGISRHNGKIRLKFLHGDPQKEYLFWKKKLFMCNTHGYIEKNGYSKKPAWSTTTGLFYFPFDVLPGRLNKDLPNALIEKIDWRSIAVWYMDDGTIASTNATFCTHSFSEQTVLLLVDKLKSMGVDCKKGIERKKDGRAYPTIELSSVGTRYMLDNIRQYIHPMFQYKDPCGTVGGYVWSTVKTNKWLSLVEEVKTVVYKPRVRSKDDRHQSFVYDLSVDGNHNYLVANSYNKPGNFLLAHNCHTLAADTLSRMCLGALQNAPYRFFVSATQMRTDGLDLLLEAITGPVVYELTLRQLVDMGYLARPRFNMVQVPPNGVRVPKDPMKAIQQHLLYNPYVNKRCGELANKCVETGRSTLILVDEIEQFTTLLPHFRYEAKFAHGGVTKANAHKIPNQYHKCNPSDLVKEFNEGKFPILVGTSCVAVGTDFQNVGALFYLMGGTSEIQVSQAVGRGTRGGVNGQVYKQDGTKKTDFLFFDFDVDFCGDTDGELITHRHAMARKKIYDGLYGPVNIIKI
jgi:superfamily II DNA or RNA helicase